jgi:hypothetical protein
MNNNKIVCEITKNKCTICIIETFKLICHISLIFIITLLYIFIFLKFLEFIDKKNK